MFLVRRRNVYNKKWYIMGSRTHATAREAEAWIEQRLNSPKYRSTKQSRADFQVYECRLVERQYSVTLTESEIGWIIDELEELTRDLSCEEVEELLLAKLTAVRSQ